MTQSVHQNVQPPRTFMNWEDEIRQRGKISLGGSGLIGWTTGIKTLRAKPPSELTTQESNFLNWLAAEQAKGSSKRFKIARLVTTGIIGIAAGGAAYSVLGASSGTSLAAGGAKATASTATAAKAALGSGYEYLGGAVLSSQAAPALTFGGVAATAVNGAKAVTLTGLIKDYGGAALKMLAGSARPTTSDEAIMTPPFNSAGTLADYGFGYGSGGGFGGGPMLTSGGEEVSLFDTLIDSPMFLIGGGALLLLLSFFFLRR